MTEKSAHGSARLGKAIWAAALGRNSWHGQCFTSGRPLQALVELTRFLATSQDLREALHAIVQCVAQHLDVEDCRIVLAREGDLMGQVAAAAGVSSREASASWSVDLDAHPEIEHALSSGETLVHEHESCLVVVPIGYDTAWHGVLYTQFRPGQTLDPTRRSLLQVLANAAGMTLRNAQMSESLSNEKKQTSRERARVEHRIKFFQRYADFFESAADGMVVVDHAGRILFSNPRTSEITGYLPCEIDGTRLSRFLSRREIARAAGIVRGFRAGVYPRGVDIRFIPKSARGTSDPKQLILNVTFSPVLRAEGAVLLTFKDVTVERATEVELRRTTEFLARVIDSSVDAIVSADMTGRLLLFNRAAARIFGYEPADVIGKLSVERLYPEGVAREVMRQIRSEAHGGPERLEDY
ncbi:MAG TPA: PAS domain S-box protein, partial [Polyangiaceae bacterium]|nr:PAS domain S-box protein [Polyangiaceae bacterium]